MYSVPVPVPTFLLEWTEALGPDEALPSLFSGGYTLFGKGANSPLDGLLLLPPLDGLLLLPPDDDGKSHITLQTSKIVRLTPQTKAPNIQAPKVSNGK